MSAVLAAAFCAGASLLPSTADAAGSWVGTATQAMPLKNFAVAPMAPQQQLHIVVGLNARNKAQLDALVAQIGKPGSPQFGHNLTSAEFLASYAPTADQANAVVSYLRGLGFSNIEVSGNRLTVSAYGSAATVQQAFNTQLVSFVAQGRSLFANATPAQVPASLGGIVAAVIGLNNMGGMTTNLQHASASKPALTRGISSVRPNSGVPQDPILTPPYGGPQYQTAYDAGNTPTGWGTAIGIITEGDITQVPKDLRAYEKEWNLPQVPYEIVPTGLQTSDTAGLDEWDLDSQSSSGIAGNLKKIIFYNGGSLGDPDIAPAIERAVSENRVKAVNMSFGGCETIEYLSGAMLIEDIAFEQGAAQGITFFASSGDGGASCQLLINAGQPVLLGAVEYPAASPYVVAVGGTSLLTNADYSYNSELSWVSGGGGISLWEVPGVWTAGVINPVNTAAAQRAVPDIAMVGDPNIGGADVVVSGADIGVGGTSLSSPLSVGVWARMQTAHGNCYGFAAPIFYATYGQSFGTAAKDLHDIVLGDNFLYPATPGWDYDTGMGSFDIAAANTALPAVSCAPAAPDGLTAGLVGGTVMLNWSGVAGATSYAIYEGMAGGAEGATPVATTSNTNTLIKGLAGGQTYYFTVKAVNAAGSSGVSNEASVTTPQPGPAAPTGLTATQAAAHGAVYLAWKVVGGAAGYRVYAGTASGTEGATPIALVSGSNAYLASGLTVGKTYYFEVSAVSGGIEGSKSGEISLLVK
ncbi:MAG TPA: protease pro-enzyme activation domain-containing protein [Nevskia sp.]|nr:protease pro-enzyme activation domain-containing protein [Nevskia sp.]